MCSLYSEQLTFIHLVFQTRKNIIQVLMLVFLSGIVLNVCDSRAVEVDTLTHIYLPLGCNLLSRSFCNWVCSRLYVSPCLNTPGELQSGGPCNNVPDLVHIVPCVGAREEKESLFPLPTGAEVSCDPYYGVNLLWCIMAHSMETYFISSLWQRPMFYPLDGVVEKPDHIRCCAASQWHYRL